MQPRMQPRKRVVDEDSEDAFWLGGRLDFSGGANVSSLQAFPKEQVTQVAGRALRPEETRLWRESKEAVKDLVGEVGAKFGIPAPVAVDLLITYFLALRRQRMRQREGAIHLSSGGRLSLYFGSEKATLRPVSLVVREEQPLAHLLVEECMVLANHCVAEEILSAQRETVHARVPGRNPEGEVSRQRDARTVRTREAAADSEARKEREATEKEEGQERTDGGEDGRLRSSEAETEGGDGGARRHSRQRSSDDTDASHKNDSEADAAAVLNGAQRKKFERKVNPFIQEEGAEAGDEEGNAEARSVDGESEKEETEADAKSVAFGGLLRAHGGSNDEAVKFLRDTLDRDIWMAFKTHLQAQSAVGQANTSGSLGAEAEERAGDQDDVSGIKLSHLLDFCKSRLSAPVYNALCFSVLQEFFLQAQYVAPAAAASKQAGLRSESASPTETERQVMPPKTAESHTKRSRALQSGSGQPHDL
ncbi:RNB family domain-containing protein, partial [Toxoplasma gondii TgCatPRC2]